MHSDGPRIGLLGPVIATTADGAEIDLRGPRHRELLARLATAHGRTVPVEVLVADLWTAPPSGAVAAVRTFVAALRRALEPDRPPRTPGRVLVTAGAGYALRVPEQGLDSTRFGALVRPGAPVADLRQALDLWRGPAFDGIGEAPWLVAERARLDELRLHAVELLAAALLDARTPELAVPDLLRHTATNPWREEGWRLLALAQAGTGRQTEALETLRGARTRLAEEFGLDPGPALRDAEQRVLGGTPTTAPRWQATVDALRHLALSGGEGLAAARAGRTSTLDAAEALDPRLAARVVGGFDPPALWTRSDDPGQAARIVAHAERLLDDLGPQAPTVLRARLLATVGVELRGVRGARGRSAALEAERLARELDNPAVLVAALDARYLTSFGRPGSTAERVAVGTELVEVSARHDLVPHEILGHLVLLQTACAGGDVAAADVHAARAGELADLEGTPLVSVFTAWFAALRDALTGQGLSRVVAGYRSAAATLDGAGMPGLQEGLLPLAIAAAHVQHAAPVPLECADAGPWTPWVEPLVLLARGDRAGAAAVLAAVTEPPPGHLTELLWCLLGHAAAELGDDATLTRALAAVEPVEDEFAGAGSGLLTAGRVADFTREFRAVLRRP